MHHLTTRETRWSSGAESVGGGGNDMGPSLPADGAATGEAIELCPLRLRMGLAVGHLHWLGDRAASPLTSRCRSCSRYAFASISPDSRRVACAKGTSRRRRYITAVPLLAARDGYDMSPVPFSTSLAASMVPEF